ncbi:hypothetical protein ABPG77_009752 [Micractinium sp. CCAP 211/92]
MCWRPAVFPSFKQHAMSRESSLQDQRRRGCKGVSRQDKRRRKGGARTEASIWLTMRKDMSIVQVGSAGSPMEPRQAHLPGMTYEAAKRFKDPLLAPYVPANSDAEGYLEAAKPGLKHPAVRDSGRDCTWRPPVANIAPRHAGWARQQAGGS